MRQNQRARRSRQYQINPAYSASCEDFRDDGRAHLQNPSCPFKRRASGEMAEWLKAHAWKACVRETVPWVRIPLSPPEQIVFIDLFQIFWSPPPGPTRRGHTARRVHGAHFSMGR